MRGNSSNLDLLRALAVITVMIDHLMPTLVFHGIHPPMGLQKFFEHVGHAGVLAFFVHTSLVLMYSLERMDQPGTDALAGRFYVRRFFRIYPLAIVVVLVVIGLQLPEKTWHPYAPATGKEIAANLLLVQNLWTGRSVLVPLWSLPYEVEMYVILPILYLFARRKDGIHWLVHFLMASYVAAFVFLKLEGGHMNLAAYVPCFLVGVLCYPVIDKVKPRLPGSLWVPFVIGLIATYCWAQLIAWQNIYWMGWGMCLVLGAGIVLFRENPSRILAKVGAKIATYSYGIYLLHVPALYVIFDVLKMRAVVPAIGAWVALTAALAIVAYHLIEQPMVALGRRLSERRAAST